MKELIKIDIDQLFLGKIKLNILIFIKQKTKTKSYPKSELERSKIRVSEFL